ncbi:MAG: WD40/YVTN/BNR-like repeat-containing protein [Micromonosporaceae bacterium]
MPAGFEPQSVTFVSAARGWVLGAVPGGRAPYASLVRTVDGGRTWQGIPAPRAPLAKSGQKAGVRTLRFADRLDGWAYGPDLYVTHNGGTSWHKLALGGSVADLEAAGGAAYASVVDARGTVSLYSSQVGNDSWSLAVGVPRGLSGSGEITLHGRAGWLITRDRLYATTTGAQWHRLANPSAAQYGMASLAAYDEQRVTLLCWGNGAAGSSGKIVYTSRDGGRSFIRAGQAPLPGIGGTLAQPEPARVFLATSSGASWIYGSFDGGRTWRTVLTAGAGGMPWADFGFTTPVQGVAVIGTPGPDGSALYMTRNGGSTWSRVRFTATLTTAGQRQLATATLSGFRAVLIATRVPGNSPGPQATVTAAGYKKTPGGWKLIATKTIGKPGGWFWYSVEVCSLTITQLKPLPSSAQASDTVTVNLLMTPALGCSGPITVDFGSGR